ncbi:MAG: hypothetical protein IJW82_03060 [Clostridia bacterium]|nr:hypothetical protein [Clostridia bacterium]
MDILFTCLKIFICRIIDVSLGTVRTISTVRGKTLFASTVGFIEVTIWFLIVQDALKVDVEFPLSILVAISYAGGFATGTYLGGKIVKTFIKSTISMQIITSSRDVALLDKIKELGFPMTVCDVYGRNHEDGKYLLYIQIDSKVEATVRKEILAIDNKAYIFVNDIKAKVNGVDYSIKK